MFGYRYYLNLTFFLLFPLLSFAQNVKVQNVTFRQSGELIIVNYDLEGDASKKYKIQLSLSEDYGVSYRYSLKSVTGDVGKNVKPGRNKEIIWEMLKDFSKGIEGEGYVFAVDAELQKGGGKFVYYLIGGGAIGGTVYYFTRPKDEKGSISVSLPGEF